MLGAVPEGMPDPNVAPPQAARAGDPFSSLRIVVGLARISRNVPHQLRDVVTALNAAYLDWSFSEDVVLAELVQLQSNWSLSFHGEDRIVLGANERGSDGPHRGLDQDDAVPRRPGAGARRSVRRGPARVRHRRGKLLRTNRTDVGTPRDHDRDPHRRGWGVLLHRPDRLPGRIRPSPAAGPGHDPRLHVPDHARSLRDRVLRRGQPRQPGGDRDRPRRPGPHQVRARYRAAGGEAAAGAGGVAGLRTPAQRPGTASSRTATRRRMPTGWPKRSVPRRASAAEPNRSSACSPAARSRTRMAR